MKKNNFWLIFCILTLGIIFLFQPALVVRAQDNTDAIGVRIIPNPNHYSITRWYESQGFTGSPQILTVDGYEAIRDGRTVYVNAANVDKNSSLIFTNIYLISYNQNSADKTVDILGQIISHWKFNSNLENPLSSMGTPNTCSISSVNCLSDADCGADQACGTSTDVLASCVLKNPKNCNIDSDCPLNFFCNNLKSKVIRDVKRVGRLEELKEALFRYKTLNNHYPTLEAGSYLSGHTISVWPSWTQGFLINLAVSQNFVDPINRLGACPGYDFKTCWNKDTKRFVYNPVQSHLTLPANSYALAYGTDANGSDYSLCAVLETRGGENGGLDYHFSPNDPSNSDCVVGTGIISGGQATNTRPILLEKSLTGETGQEFNGFVKVVDQEGNPLTWTLNTSLANWGTWKNNNALGQPPILKDTNKADQKKIYAQMAGAPGIYNAVLTVSDGQGGIMTTSTPLKIVNSAPFIEAEDADYAINSINPFVYEFSFTGKNFSSASTSYSVVKISGPSNVDIINNTAIAKSFSSTGINKYKVSYQGFIPQTFPNNFQFYQNTDFVYQITVSDQYSSATKKFTIHIISENPFLSFNCPASVRLGKDYACFIGPLKQGNHNLSYTSGFLPDGLSLTSYNNAIIDTSTIQQDTSLKNHIWSFVKNNILNLFDKINSAWAAHLALPTDVYLNGQPSTISSGQTISIKATNEYGASSTRSFILRVNNFCGDGYKQLPNLEGRGGVYNDGYEDCDGYSGVTSDPTHSSSTVQYGCTTVVGGDTPSIIPDNNYCVFRSPLDGGGFCGDNICQATASNSNGTTTLETTTNCSSDCGEPNNACIPDCNNKKCGSDGCTGQCPPGCSNSQICFNFLCDDYDCGNGTCDVQSGESCANCSQDCGNCAPTGVCGDGVCDNIDTENCSNCLADCACPEDTYSCIDKQCVPSNNNCNCEGRTCGPDSCGNGGPTACGTCSGLASCTTNGQCCQANCNGCVGYLNTTPVPCGGACCNSSTEVCCGNTCQPKASNQVCGSTCCSLPYTKCCQGGNLRWGCVSSSLNCLINPD